MCFLFKSIYIFTDINREYIMYSKSIKVTANKEFDIKIIDLKLYNSGHNYIMNLNIAFFKFLVTKI